MADLTGHTLGQYEILELIGRGGMADVYRGVQKSIGREVAIKVLPPEYLRDPTFLERFTREVQVIANLQHPQILPVYDFGEQDGMPYIVMAYLPGGSLADRIKQADTGLPLDEVVYLVDGVTRALDHAHKRGIIHRDFKPSNVLLDEEGNVYLSDFGIARVAEATAQLTGSGIIGTPAYMAPEMSAEGGVTALVDVYALGVSVYEMLSGRHPYRADTPMGVLMAHGLQPIPDVREVRPDLPDEVQVVIERAMAKEPTQRYRSAGELAEALQHMMIPTDTLPEPAPSDVPAVEMIEPTTEPVVEVSAPAELEPPSTMPPTIDTRPEPETPTEFQGPAVGASLTVVEKPTPRRGLPAWVWVGGGLLGIVAVVALVLGIGAISGWPGGGESSPTADKEATSMLTGADSTDTPFAPARPTLIGGGSGQIAFLSDRDGTHEVYIINADGTGSYRLTNNDVFELGFSLSPNGRLMAFQVPSDGFGEIYVMDVGGSSPRLLTEDKVRPAFTVWSPDWTQILFVPVDDEDADIFVMDADGANRTQLTSNDADDIYPAWSPDGLQIAFVSNRDGNYELYTMNADGSIQTRFTNSTADEYMPTWSPDGKRLVFISDTSGEGDLLDILVVNQDGSGLVHLVEGVRLISGPKWSPDGTLIAFSADNEGQRAIYTIKVDGTGLQQLMLDSSFSPTNFDISADGTKIVLESDHEGNHELYIVNMDGSDLLRLTDSPAWDQAPRWLSVQVNLAEQPDHEESPTADEEAEPTDTPSPLGFPGNPVISNDQWVPVIQEFNRVEMALVPAGCFRMGSEDGEENERPVHEVCFEKPFWIDVYEVTNAQYGQASQECWNYSSADDQPAVCMTWFEAVAHCEARGTRLPTEAEWEYAARGPDGLKYPWGNDFLADSVVYSENSGGHAWEVGNKPSGVSWVGALDLSGNVWEWVADWYGTYQSGRQVNPSGPGSGEYRVLRGGSWYLVANLVRAANRYQDRPGNSRYLGGLRCARSSQP